MPEHVSWLWGIDKQYKLANAGQICLVYSESQVGIDTATTKWMEGDSRLFVTWMYGAH